MNLNCKSDSSLLIIAVIFLISQLAKTSQFLQVNGIERVIQSNVPLTQLIHSLEVIRTSSLNDVPCHSSGLPVNLLEELSQYQKWKVKDPISRTESRVDSIEQDCGVSQSVDGVVSLMDLHSSAHLPIGTKLTLTVLLTERYGQAHQSTDISKLFADNQKRNWTVGAVYIINERNLKKHIVQLSSSESDIFFIDLPGKMTIKLLKEAYAYGLHRRFSENIWILSTTTTQTLPILSHIPDTLIVGFRETKSKTERNPCIREHMCGVQSNRITTTEVLQLLNNATSATGKSWRLIGSLQNTSFSVKLFINRISMLPKLRVVTGDSYMPYVQINPRGTGDDCGLNGMKGYRYENATSVRKVDICAHGRDVDFVRYLERELGFEAEIYVPPDGTWGRTGAVGDIFSGVADIMISSYTVSGIDMTISHQEGIAIAYLQKDNNVGSMGVGAPFSTKVWLFLLGIFAVAVLVLWILECISPYGNFQKRKRSNKDFERFGLGDSLNYTWALGFSGEIMNKKPQSSSGRVMAILVSLFAIGLVVMYTGNIISFLVVSDDTPPITGLLDPKLLESRVKIAVLKGSVTAEKLKISGIKQLRRLYNTLLYVKSLDDGLKNLMDRKIDYFIGDYLSLQYFSALHEASGLRVVKVKILPFRISLAFRKGLGWKNQISSAIAKMMTTGRIDLIDEEYILNRKTCSANLSFLPLGIAQFKDLFIILCGGILLALVIAIIACIVRRMKANTRCDRDPEIAEER